MRWIWYKFNSESAGCANHFDSDNLTPESSFHISIALQHDYPIHLFYMSHCLLLPVVFILTPPHHCIAQLGFWKYCWTAHECQFSLFFFPKSLWYKENSNPQAQCLWCSPLFSPSKRQPILIITNLLNLSFN